LLEDDTEFGWAMALIGLVGIWYASARARYLIPWKGIEINLPTTARGALSVE
jgi:hypothetical protein